MEKLLETLEEAVLALECIWRMKECENSYAVERAYNIVEEFLKECDNSLEAARRLAERMDEVIKVCDEALEDARRLAERMDEVLKECECHEGE